MILISLVSVFVLFRCLNPSRTKKCRDSLYSKAQQKNLFLSILIRFCSQCKSTILNEISRDLNKVPQRLRDHGHKGVSIRRQQYHSPIIHQFLIE